MTCNRRPWHHWSDWCDVIATVAAGPLTIRLAPNGPAQWTEQAQARKCSRCSKIQIRRIDQ